MKINRGLLLGPVLLLLPAAAAAQVSAAPEATAIPAISAPVWAKPDQFWFRKTVGGGNLWLKVDVQHGAKQPLFDHQRLAIELSLRSGMEYTPMTLPLADPAAEFVVKYDGSNAYIQEGAMAIEFIHGGDHWRCDLQIKWDWNRVPPTDYECLPRRPVDPDRPVRTLADIAADNAAAAIRPSPDGRWEALIVNHNVAVRPAGNNAPGALRMLTTDGTTADAWQGGSLRWSDDSATLTGYRVDEQVWLSNSVTGNVEALVEHGEWMLGAETSTAESMNSGMH
ncbi:MAG: hypothetical protein WEF86_06030 [Gemmatimonadota bacterium]